MSQIKCLNGGMLPLLFMKIETKHSISQKRIMGWITVNHRIEAPKQFTWRGLAAPKQKPFKRCLEINGIVMNFRVKPYQMIIKFLNIMKDNNIII